ncbi:ATP-grasp domain-containing protein [Streptomyces europaeiscabiei]|uniref:ATP-grasp domain-containing protein n=1 Tax=Streptomyces europaeiscabiei TaxID=146819 RepID=UPI0038F653C2
MRVAIVDGYSTGAVLPRRLRDNGAKSLHIRSSATTAAYLLRSFQPADYTHDLGYIPDEDLLTRRLEQEGVNRVIAGSESGVTLAETLSLRLGLPTNTGRLRAARRDKALMGQVIAKAGLATPLAALASSGATGAAWFTDHGLAQAVVKPLSSAGTDNVHFCRTADEVAQACSAVLSSASLFGVQNRAALVQERLHGQEFYINTVSAHGLHRVAEMWRYTKREGAAATPVYDFEEPVDTASAEAKMLRDYTFAVLDALGIRNSPAHTEVMLTDRGPVLIETGARLGGATAPDVIEKYSGVSQASLAAATIVDPSTIFDFDDRKTTWSGAVRCVEFINHHAGTASASVIDKVASLPTTVSVVPSVTPGDRIEPTTDLLTSPGYAYLAADDLADVQHDYEQLRGWEEEGLHTR